MKQMQNGWPGQSGNQRVEQKKHRAGGHVQPQSTFVGPPSPAAGEF
jgi:hypothetical protein